jgi:hypothetical protein
MSDNPMPFGEIAEKRTSGTNPPPHRPFHSDDIRAGAEVLSRRLAMGSPFDVIVAVREILDASGCISSRATPRPPNQPRKKEGVTNGSQPPSAP